MNWLITLPKPVNTGLARPIRHYKKASDEDVAGWKCCTRCGVCKPFEEYSWKAEKRLSAGGRLASQCKRCLAQKQAARKLRRQIAAIKAGVGVTK